MLILAIDTSCDETSVAISKDDCILANVISSQVDLHRHWGGVVPSIARRAHQENIDLCLAEALKRARLKIESIDVLAVTYGPGLAITLEVGIGKIKELAQKYHKPVVAINHMEGHILANFAKNSRSSYYSLFSQFSPLSLFPFLALLISGGHTELILVKNFGQYQKIGQTLDDAIGEAYDKVAKMLNLGYPGGPIIEELAKKGNRQKYNLPVPMEKNPGLDFSYSGLKTSILYLIKRLTTNDQKLSKKQIVDIAASFEKVAADHLVQRTRRALKKYQVQGLLLGGGVVANRYIRSRLRQLARQHHLPLIWPGNVRFCGDNAAMICVTAYYETLKKEFVKDLNNLDRDPILSI